jgi:hypothetical protein
VSTPLHNLKSPPNILLHPRGFAWQNTQYSEPSLIANTQNLATGLVAGEVRLFRFNKTNLDFTGALYPALNQPGRVKFNTNATYYIKITGNLLWNVSFYGNWGQSTAAWVCRK